MFVFTIVLSLIVFMLGVFVVVKNFRKKENLFFFFFSLSIAVWIIFLYLSNSSKTPATAIFWTQATWSESVLLPITFVFFLLAAIYRKKITFSDVILTVATCLFNLYIFFLGNALSHDVSFYENTIHVGLGSSFLFFLAMFFAWFVRGVYLLIIGIFKLKGLTLQRIKVILFFFLSGSLVAIITNVVLVVLEYNQYTYLGPVGIILICIGSAYSIVRYRLFNIRFIITRSIIYLILVAFIAVLFVAISSFTASYVERTGYINQYIIWTFFAFIIVLGLDPLKRWFAKLTDSVFFKDKIDYNVELKTLSNLINEEIELGSLVTNFRLLLAQRLKLKHNNVLIAAETDKVYVPLDYFTNTSSADSNEQIRKHHLYNDSPFIQYVRQQRKTIVTDELDRYIYDLNDEYKQQQLTQVLDNLNELKAGAIVPIRRQEKLTGILIIGEKASGETFSSEDINLFEVIAAQLAAALERSRLYQEVRVFNIKLQKEVEKATASLQYTNEQLTDANAHLQELDRAKSEFMSIASHQLRTPLTGIVGYLSMILEGDYGKVDEKIVNVMKQVFQASQRLVRLVNMLLNVTRIEAGRFTLNFVATNLVEVVNTEINELMPTTAKKGLKLSLSQHTPKQVMVMVDQDKIRDVILNLIDNSIKYTEEGSVTVELQQEGEQAHFTVTDTGVGIDPADAGNLFQKFVRGSGIAQIQPNGSGLGLYIVKKIVEGHGGKVWVESQGLKKGSTFHVLIPLKQQKESYKSEPEEVFKAA
ncbi:MAG: ATP-binding protein [Patescibacteria group bacterium]|jgi:signal transduction histidine kinase